MNKTRLEPIHPGEVLEEEFLEPLRIDEGQLSLRTGIEPAQMKAIIERQGQLTADRALRLAKYFGTSPQFWLGIQSDYDLDMAKERLGDKLDEEIVPIAA